MGVGWGRREHDIMDVCCWFVRSSCRIFDVFCSISDCSSLDKSASTSVLCLFAIVNSYKHCTRRRVPNLLVSVLFQTSHRVHT